MKPIWAIEPIAFGAFLKGLVLKLKAGQNQEHPRIEVDLAADAETIHAGPVEDAQRAGFPVQKNGSMAIINITGPMMKNVSWLRYFGFAGTSDMRMAIRSAVADDEVDQILLRIDSPGGTVDGTAELADEVKAAAAEKNVIAQVDGMAASAAYWVASQANAIYSGRMDLIGSIGVRMAIYDFSAMFDEAGIKAIAIDTGDFKSTGLQGTEITDDQVAYLQGIVDAQFQEFRSAVMAGRVMSSDQFDQVADGRVFTADDAMNLGLIDRIQNIDMTVSNFKSQAIRKARLALSQTA